jgi:hypothetical protein
LCAVFAATSQYSGEIRKSFDGLIPFFEGQKPVLLKGGVKNWPAHTMWHMNNLRTSGYNLSFAPFLI